MEDINVYCFRNKKDPEHIVQNLKNKLKNKSTPGAKEF